MTRAILSALLVSLLGAAADRAEPIPVDGVAAWVNGHAITVMDVLMEAQPLYAALAQEKGLTRDEMNTRRMAIYRQVRRSLVDTELIYAAYQKEKAKSQATVTDQMLDSRIDDIIQGDFGGSREKLMKALAEERMTYDEWREKMGRRIIVQGLRAREVTAKAQVSPKEVQAYYEDHRADYEHPGQVLLRRIVLVGADAETRSRKIMDSLYEGGNFAALAKRISTAPDAAQGGAWGWKNRADLAPELADKLNGMRVGGICRVELGGDWHIVMLEGRDVVSYDDARAAIEERLLRIETLRLHELWMDKLEREFHVKFVEQPLWKE